MDIGNKFSKGNYSKILLMSQAFDMLQKQGIKREEVMSKVHDVIMRTLLCFSHHLVQTYTIFYPQDMLGDKCFEFMQFKMIVDTDGKPWLIGITRNVQGQNPEEMEVIRKAYVDMLTMVSDNKEQKNIKHKIHTQRSPSKLSVANADLAFEYRKLTEAHFEKKRGGFQRIVSTEDKLKKGSLPTLGSPQNSRILEPLSVISNPAVDNSRLTNSGSLEKQMNNNYRYYSKTNKSIKQKPHQVFGPSLQPSISKESILSHFQLSSREDSMHRDES